MTTSKNLFNPTLPINQIVQEINWPLLASIALHGVFFTSVFPELVSQNSPNSNSFNNTPVIELNYLEQTRLPNLNPSNSFNWDSLNPLPEINNFNGLIIPLPPLENKGFDLPQLNNDVIYNDFASLPPPPPAGMTNFFAPPIPQTYDDLDVSNLSPVNLPPPPPLNQNSLANLPPIPDEKINEIREGNNVNTSSPFNSNMPINQILDQERQAEIRRQLFANTPIEMTVNPRDVINNRDNKIDLRNDPSSIVDQENPLPTNLRTQFDNLTEKLVKNPENTSDEEARKNYVAWAQKVENVAPREISLAGVYPKDACVKKLEGITTYGIMVDSMGNVINSQLIKSAGYSLFNEQALRQINARQFENTGNGNVPYHVYVNFEYDSKICPSVSLSNLGNTPSSTPTNPIPPTNNSTAITPAQPSTSNLNRKKTTENEPKISNPTIDKNPENNPATNNNSENTSSPPSTSQPIRVNNLPTSNNNADALKIPDETRKKSTNPPPLPPIIESPPKQETEKKTLSPREIINSPINSSASSEKNLGVNKSSDNEIIMDSENQESPPKVDEVN